MQFIERNSTAEQSEEAGRVPSAQSATSAKLAVTTSYGSRRSSVQGPHHRRRHSEPKLWAAAGQIDQADWWPNGMISKRDRLVQGAKKVSENLRPLARGTRTV